MNTGQSTSRLNTQILEEAAEWFVEFSTGDVDTQVRQRFDVWLRISPEHVRAYLELLPVWEDAALPRPGQDTSPERLIALAHDAGNIVPLETRAAVGGRTRHAEPGELPRGIASLRRVAVAAAILMVVAGLAAWLAIYRPPTYTADVGEQRSITLADGSTVELNARSRVRVRFSDRERDVDLLEGQALFHVARDPTRPFIVNSNETRVRAVGTQFDVYRKKTGTTVTVLEGRVAVLTEKGAGSESFVQGSASDAGTAAKTPSGARPRTVFLSAGEQVTVSVADTAALVPTHPNIAAATAWTQRRLVFNSASLTDVAEEFNRYNVRQLVIRAPELAHLRINGVFSSTEPAPLLRFLREQPGVRVDDAGDAIVISGK